LRLSARWCVGASEPGGETMNVNRSGEPSRTTARLLQRHLADAAHLLALGEHRSAAHLVDHVLDLASTHPTLDREVTVAAVALLRSLGDQPVALCGS
jgi:hypothetical protein